MIDIHHHLLFGLDDGPSNIDTSIAMARIAAEEGITHVVCTPHANGQYTYDPPVIDAKIEELQTRLNHEGIALKLGRGCDFHMSYDNIQDAKADPTRFSINGLGYLLIELPDYGISRSLTEILYELRIAGLIPILTHPERNLTLQADQARMADWLRGGLIVQVTAGSVLGLMGRTAQRAAHQLLEKRWVHFLATDAHNTSSRPPRMREAFELVATKYGPDYAHALCVGNPLAVVQGKPLPPQAEPLGLYEDTEPRTWLQRLFKR